MIATDALIDSREDASLIQQGVFFLCHSQQSQEHESVYKDLLVFLQFFTKQKVLCNDEFISQVIQQILQVFDGLAELSPIYS